MFAASGESSDPLQGRNFWMVRCKFPHPLEVQFLVTENNHGCRHKIITAFAQQIAGVTKLMLWFCILRQTACFHPISPLLLNTGKKTTINNTAPWNYNIGPQTSQQPHHTPQDCYYLPTVLVWSSVVFCQSVSAGEDFPPSLATRLQVESIRKCKATWRKRNHNKANISPNKACYNYWRSFSKWKNKCNI